jgi:hypothetical protein
MPPQLANFSINVVKEVFAAHGIHVLETYTDGQIMWGDQPMAEPCGGKFCISDFFVPGRYDIFTVGAIINRLGKNAERQAIEDALYARMHEGYDDDDGEKKTPDIRPPLIR